MDEMNEGGGNAMKMKALMELLEMFTNMPDEQPQAAPEMAPEGLPAKPGLEELV